MSFRRFVHLVVDDVHVRRRSYSLRNIDVSCLFRRPPEKETGRPDHRPPATEEMEPSPLPDPAMSFCPPRNSLHGGDETMEFMLLGGKHNKVVATDQTGRAVLYDPDRHAVHTLRSFAKPKKAAVALTAGGGDDLYVLSAFPPPGDEDACFECLEHGGVWDDEDWYPRVLPPPPPFRCDDNDEEEPDDPWSTGPRVVSYAISGDGARIWVTHRGSGTYAFDTAAERWSKAGDWALPFAGAAAFAPEHGLWFGLRDDRCVLCAVDLAPRRQAPPAVRHVWEDLAPPAEWPAPLASRLVHLGAAKFCVARFFPDDPSTCRHYPVTRAVFTGVEVERCADADGGGLRMVKHRSKLYTRSSTT
ncbi:hypothetical protein EJB05_00624, partial [Eragrostis curvula]